MGSFVIRGNDGRFYHFMLIIVGMLIDLIIKKDGQWEVHATKMTSAILIDKFDAVI